MRAFDARLSVAVNESSPTTATTMRAHARIRREGALPFLTPNLTEPT
jgi:hypothetical protein